MRFSILLAVLVFPSLSFCKKDGKSQQASARDKTTELENEVDRPTDDESLPYYIDELQQEFAADEDGEMGLGDLSVRVEKGTLSESFKISLQALRSRGPPANGVLLLGGAHISLTQGGGLVERHDLLKPIQIRLKTSDVLTDTRKVFVKAVIGEGRAEETTQIIYNEDLTFVDLGNGQFEVSFHTTDTEATFYIFESTEIPSAFDRYILPPPALVDSDIEPAVITLSALSIRWKDVGGTAIGYVVMYAQGRIAPATCEGGEFTAGSSYLLEDLDPDTFYSFIICTINARVDGADVSHGYQISLKTLADANEQVVKKLPSTIKVEPRFPFAGKNWNDYVKGTIDEAQDASCGILDTDCTHGAEYKKVVVTGINSCDGLEIEETLDSLYWFCSVVSGTATFYSYGLKEYRYLSTILNAEGNAFKLNSVTVRLHGELVTSASELWWQNAVVVANDLTSLSQMSTIYTLTQDLDSDGIDIAEDKIALVVYPGVFLKSAGSLQSCGSGAEKCLVRHIAHNFTWIEGNFAVDNSSPQLTNVAAVIESSSYVRFDHVMTINSIVGALKLVSSQNLYLRDISSGNGKMLNVQNSTKLRLNGLKGANLSGINLGDGAIIINSIIGFAPNGENIVFSNITSPGGFHTQGDYMIVQNLFSLYEDEHAITDQFTGINLSFQNPGAYISFAGGFAKPVNIYGKLFAASCEGPFSHTSVTGTSCSSNGDFTHVSSETNQSVHGYFNESINFDILDTNRTSWLLSDLFTGWKVLGSTWGPCVVSGVCQRYDFSLKVADNVLRNTLACPTALNTATHTWSNGEVATVILNAAEILGFGGNQNGLCEKGEHCLYTPNIGAYQGHGKLLRADVVNSTSNNCADILLDDEEVTLFKYSINGRASPF